MMNLIRSTSRRWKRYRSESLSNLKEKGMDQPISAHRGPWVGRTGRTATGAKKPILGSVLFRSYGRAPTPHPACPRPGNMRSMPAWQSREFRRWAEVKGCHLQGRPGLLVKYKSNLIKRNWSPLIQVFAKKDEKGLLRMFGSSHGLVKI